MYWYFQPSGEILCFNTWPLIQLTTQKTHNNKNQQHMRMFRGFIFTLGQKVAVLWCECPRSQLKYVTPRAGIPTGPRILPWSEWEERRPDERGGLTLSFKSPSPAPLSARIDLALPWIHPGRQQQRMHKAHYSEHAYSHTCTWASAHTWT